MKFCGGKWPQFAYKCRKKWDCPLEACKIVGKGGRKMVGEPSSLVYNYGYGRGSWKEMAPCMEEFSQNEKLPREGGSFCCHENKVR